MNRNCVMFVLTALLAATSARGEGARHIHFFYGHKSLSSEWAPLDGHDEFGIVSTIASATWPVAIAADAFYSDQTVHLSGGSEFGDYPVQMQTYEYALGVRKIWSIGAVRFGLGGGFAWIKASRDDNFKGSGDAIGPWAGTSCYYHARGGFDVGAQLRWSSADVEFPDLSVYSPGFKGDAGGLHAGITIGYGW